MTTFILNQWSASGFVKALSWMLVHSLWQGLALAIIAGVMIQCTKRAGAAVRYTFLLVLFVCFLISTGTTFFLQYQKQNTYEVQTIHTSVTTGDLIQPVESIAKGFSSSGTDGLQMLATHINSYAHWIVLAWLAIFILQCLKLAGGLFHIQQLRRRDTVAAPVYWTEELERLACSMGLHHPIRILQSARVKAPVVLGFFKPLVLVPVGMFAQLPPDQVEAILIHELAHIKRRDYVVNLLQEAAEAVFFFNPGLRWLSAKMRQEREACCDDQVVAHTEQKTTYLHALVAFQEQFTQSRDYTLALAGTKMHLLARVQRMLTYENNKLNTMEKIFLLTGMVAFTAYGVLRTEELQLVKQTTTSVSTPYTAIKQNLQTIALPRVFEKPKPKAEVVPEQKKKTPVPVMDTVPKKTLISSYYSSQEDGASRSEVKFKDESGKTYRLKKEDGKITAFEIDGKPVPESEWSSHKETIEEIERTMKDQQAKSEAKRKEAEIKRKEADKKRIEMQAKQKDFDALRKENEERMIANRKKHDENQAKFEEKRKLFEKDHEKMMNKRIEMDKQMQKNKLTRDEISTIIGQLEIEEVISSRENLSFSLDNQALIVNGKKQPAEVHQRYKERYLHKEKDAISYSRSGNSTSTSIVRD